MTQKDILLLGGLGLIAYLIYKTSKPAEAAPPPSAAPSSIPGYPEGTNYLEVTKKGVKVSIPVKIFGITVRIKSQFVPWELWTKITGKSKKETAQDAKQRGARIEPGLLASPESGSTLGYPFAKRGRTLERILRNM